MPDHAAGLRPIQISVPDTNFLGFIEECRKQSPLAADIDTPSKTYF